MKKIMIMLAFCGAFAIVPAQTYQSGSNTGTSNTQQEDRSGANANGTYNDRSGTQEPGAQQPGTTQSDKSKSGKTYNMDDRKDHMSGTEMNKQGEHKVVVKKSKKGESKAHAGKHMKSGEKSGLSTATYTHTPEPADRTSVNVPEKVRTAFGNAYSNAKASWRKEGENFRAMFKSGKDKDALETIVVYDKNGNVVVTERELKNTECPDAIEKYCHKDNRIWKVEAKDGTNKYLIQEKDHDKWFDNSGNRIYGSGEHGAMHHGTAAAYTK